MGYVAKSFTVMRINGKEVTAEAGSELPTGVKIEFVETAVLANNVGKEVTMEAGSSMQVAAPKKKTKKKSK